MSSLLNIGLSGIQASQYALNLISNNIANASNPYYARRSFEFFEVPGDKFGAGVRLGDIRRVVDKVAEDDLLSTTQDWAKYAAISERISHLETYVDNDDVSISKYVNQAKSILDTLNTSPASVQSRNAYMYQLQNIANRFKDVGSKVTLEMQQVRDSLTNDVARTNTLLKQLGDVNQKIGVLGTSVTLTSMPLLDQRDRLLDQLSNLISYERYTDDNGSVTLQLTNGYSILAGNQVAQLSIAQQVDNPDGLDIGVQTIDGFQSLTNNITGGAMSGLISYYSDTLATSLKSLDRLALAFSENMNAQNQLGMDLNGNLGGLIFQDINSTTLASGRVMPSSNNQGQADLAVYIEKTGQLQASDYVLQFSDGTHYQLLRISDGTFVQTGELSGLPVDISVDGFMLQINSGNFVAGDQYRLSPTSGGAAQMNMVLGDPSKIALGFPISTAASANNVGNGVIDVTAIVDTGNAAFSIPKQLIPPLRVEFISATTYRLVSAADSSIVADNLTYDPLNGSDVFPTTGGYDPGYRIHLSGNIQAGDTFSIDYNTMGQGDNRNGLLMSALYTQGLIDNNQLDFATAYQNFSLDISSATNNTNMNLDASKILKEQAEARRNEVSGVEPEQEVLMLAQFQESYMASAQILNVVKETMDILFSIMRR